MSAVRLYFDADAMERILAPQQQYSIGERIRRLLHIIAASSAEEMKDRLEFLSDWG